MCTILYKKGYSPKHKGVFGRCKKCKTGLTTKGVCNSCGFAVVCAWCGDGVDALDQKIRQPDGSWWAGFVPYMGTGSIYAHHLIHIAAHSVCTSCSYDLVFPDAKPKMVAI